MDPGLRRTVTTLPVFERLIRPASSRTPRCFMTAGSLIAKGSASSLMEALGRRASLPKIARRVGSQSAAKVRSKAFGLFSIWKSIDQPGCLVNLSATAATRGQHRSISPRYRFAIIARRPLSQLGYHFAVPTRIGLDRLFFAIAAAGLAIFGLAYGELGPSGALPDWIPWGNGWVDLAALVLLAASAGFCFPRTALTSAVLIAAYLGVWALLGTPAIFTAPLSFGGWYGFCEAATSLAGAWILYAMLLRQSGRSEPRIAGERAMRIARSLFGLTCVFYGASHFAFADYTAAMVPSWLPFPLGLAYLTGLGHIAAGAAIIVGVLPRLGAVLEAIMMSLFGLLVWVPTFFENPRPQWATPPHSQWSELVVNLMLA